MTLLRLLGTAQDGGIPHLGCSCQNCVHDRRLVASLAILDGEITIIDATPDIVQQTHLYLRQPMFDRIILTHLHMGHYVGLAQLGKEAASTDRLPVHCSESVATFLQENKPFSYLIDREEIVLQTFESGEEFNIGDSTSITPIEVPHRNEDGDTHGFVIKSLVSQKECLYLPDIDRLTDEVVEMISSVDITLFDATFWSKAELPRQFDVPHPPMTEVVERLGVIKDTRFIFTHFNHSNPVLHNSLHQQYLKTRGYEVGSDGMELNLI